MEAEARENVDAGGRVGSGEKRNAFFVEEMNDFEFLVQEFFADGQIVVAVALRDFVGEALPGFGFPRGGDIFRARVFGKIGDID